MRKRHIPKTPAQLTAPDRRAALTRLIWGTAAAATGTLMTAAPARADNRHTITCDVACLLNTFTVVTPPDATDPFSNFRGTTFVVEGELYRAGTIPDGDMDFDPTSERPIGHWICRGWFINRTGRAGETDRPDPRVISHQEYLFGRITPERLFPRDQLTSSGTEGATDATQVALRSVVGGAGRFRGAAGDVRQAVIGTNITNGPNFRFAFRLT